MKKRPAIITFASSKGGVGKSTACAAIAGALAKKYGRVAILDLDQNHTLYRWHQNHKENLPNISVDAPKPEDFTSDLDRLKTQGHDYILIDVAGSFEAIIIKAIACSDLVITPAKLSEPDLREAAKILGEVRAFNNQFNVSIQHKLLVNDADTLNPHYQRHALAELDGSPLQRFSQLMMRRAPYREIFIGGLPPHYSDQGRGPVQKAVAELDQIVDELCTYMTDQQKADAA